MNQEEREAEIQWARRMVELEDERGSIVPGGAVGGPGSSARRPAEAKVSTAMRARIRVRLLARAVPLREKHAA
jgi:hypothetical protein